MNDRDIIDLYAQRRQEYLAMRERMREMKKSLEGMLKRGEIEEFQKAQFSADILSKDLHRVQDSMHFLESRVSEIFPRHRPQD